MNKEKTRAATDASRIFKKEAMGTKHTLSKAGGSASPFMLTVVALQAKPLDNPVSVLPMVALRQSCPASLCYGLHGYLK
jgi:hypothetical protein